MCPHLPGNARTGLGCFGTEAFDALCTEEDWVQSGTLIMHPLFILHFAASPGPKVTGFSMRPPSGHSRDSREGQGCLGSFGTNGFGSSADREQPVTAHLASFVYLALCSAPPAQKGPVFRYSHLRGSRGNVPSAFAALKWVSLGHPCSESIRSIGSAILCLSCIVLHPTGSTWPVFQHLQLRSTLENVPKGGAASERAVLGRTRTESHRSRPLFILHSAASPWPTGAYFSTQLSSGWPGQCP